MRASEHTDTQGQWITDIKQMKEDKSCQNLFDVYFKVATYELN